MAPPIQRGRQLAAQRVWGLVFLAVLTGLLALSVAMYSKAFADTVRVTLEADRVGNQLTRGADVKARGVVVGEVRSVTATEDGAELELRLDPQQAERIPADTRAMILPKTLFGEKFVALTFPGERATGRPLTEGAVIAQDDSATARELATALDDLLPLLQTLKPEQVSTTLNALSSALRGRGDRIGGNLVLARDYLTEINPELPRLADDLAGTADLADTLTASTDDIVALLDDLSAVNRNLVRDQGAIDRVLRDTTAVAERTDAFLQANEQRFITLARESVPNLRVYEKYAPQFPCFSASLVEDHREISNAFGNLQPGLHITLEFTEDNGPYVPGDEPEYLDRSGPTCRSLGTEGRERPIPEYRDGLDGYRDGQPVEERTGKRGGTPPTGPEGPYTYPDQRRQGPDGAAGGTSASASATPFSPASYDRAAVGAVVAPALGVAPSEVPDVAVLLFAPVARDTVVQVA